MKSSKKNAFTFIELMVTVAIILTLSAVAVPNFAAYSKKNDQENTVEQIKALINQVGNKAHNPDKDKTAYSLVLTRGGGNSPNTGSMQLYNGNDPERSIELPKGIDFGNNHSLSCGVPGKECQFDGLPLNTAVSTISLTDSNYQTTESAYNITIQIQGNPLRVAQ